MKAGREAGFDTERTRDTGTKDEGDHVIRHGGRYFVIEAKNAKLAPTDFLRQADIEAKHFAEHRGLGQDKVHPVAFVKRRGMGTLDGLALLTIREYLRLIEEVGK